MLAMVGKMHQHLCQIIGSLEGQGFIQRNVSSSQVMSNLQNILQQDILREAIQVFLGSIPNFMLAKFQIDSTKSILKSLQSPYPSGVLISAGTGSGKP